MTGMESAWLMPLLMGGMGAAQGAMGAALQGDPAELAPYGGAPGAFLDPRRTLTQNVRDVAHLGSVLGQRAGQDITLPGAFVQPTPWYGGGGLPFPVGVTGMDPAMFQPATYQQRMGAQFASPTRFNTGEGNQFGPPTDSHRWLFGLDESPADPTSTEDPIGTGYGPYRGGPDATPFPGKGWGPQDYEGVTQKNVSPPLSVGGGIPQLMANFELLGVVADPTSGDLTVDPEVMAGRRDAVTRASANEAMFTGGENMRRRMPAGPEPGTGLVQPQFGSGPGRPDPGRFPNPSNPYASTGTGLWEGFPGDPAPKVTRPKKGDPPLNT